MSRYMTDAGGGEKERGRERVSRRLVRIYVDINRRKFRGRIYEWRGAQLGVARHDAYGKQKEQTGPRVDRRYRKN